MAFSGVTSVRLTAAPKIAKEIKRFFMHEQMRISENLPPDKRTAWHNVPLYIPNNPSDRMVFKRQSDLWWNTFPHINKHTNINLKGPYSSWKRQKRTC